MRVVSIAWFTDQMRVYCPACGQGTVLFDADQQHNKATCPKCKTILSIWVGEPIIREQKEKGPPQE